MEEYEGIGFDENNYSPIPTVSGESSKRITSRPTSTPKPEDELILNRSDPTDNRGKINRINSFEITQNRAETLLKMSKGGPIKNLGAKIQSKQSSSKPNGVTQTTIRVHSLWRMRSPQEGLP